MNHRQSIVIALSFVAFSGCKTTVPLESESSEVKPAEAKTSETMPTEAKTSETMPTEAKTSETMPTEAKTSETMPAESKPNKPENQPVMFSCSMEMLSDKERLQWYIDDDGEWFCVAKNGCDACGQHYPEYIHIKDNKVLCGDEEADTTKICNINYIINGDMIVSYLHDFSEKQQFILPKDVTSSLKTIADKAIKPIFQTDSTKNVLEEFVKFLDQNELGWKDFMSVTENHAKDFKHTCIVKDSIEIDPDTLIQTIECGGCYIKQDKYIRVDYLSKQNNSDKNKDDEGYIVDHFHGLCLPPDKNIDHNPYAYTLRSDWYNVFINPITHMYLTNIYIHVVKPKEHQSNIYKARLKATVKNKWRMDSAGLWFCIDEDGCDWRGDHYNGNVHIEDNTVYCGTEGASDNCFAQIIVYNCDLPYVQTFGDRHKVKVTANKDITWKSIENQFPMPILKLDSTKDIAKSLVEFFDKNKAKSYKNSCVLIDSVSGKDGFEAKLFGCGGYDTKDYDDNDSEKPEPGTYDSGNNNSWMTSEYSTDVYLSVTSPVDRQTRIYLLLKEFFVDRPLDSYGGSGNVAFFGEIATAPFMDTTGYYLRLQENNRQSFEHAGGGGSTREIEYRTILLAGDKLRPIVNWVDTSMQVYESEHRSFDDDTRSVESTQSYYIETTASFNGKEFKFDTKKFGFKDDDDTSEQQDLLTREDFIKHKSLEEAKAKMNP